MESTSALQRPQRLNPPDLGELLAEHEPPCISVYLPTHRAHPERQQNAIRFKNAVKSLSPALSRHGNSRGASELLAPLEALLDDEDFWDHPRDGLAVLHSPNFWRVYRLQRPVPEVARAARSFYTKPLLRIHQSADRYHVLGITRDQVRFFEGNRDVLDEVELDGVVPVSLDEALGPYLDDRPYRHGREGTRQDSRERRDDGDMDVDRFLRLVDRAVYERFSKPSGLPLLLAALPEHQGCFRAITKNPCVAKRGVETNPLVLSEQALRTRAWQAFEPQYRAKLAQLANIFNEGKAKALASDRLDEIACAAREGRVDTLMIDAGREIPGHLDADTGACKLVHESAPFSDDLLDELAEWVLRKGGQVAVLPSAALPSTTGAAAIYRF